MAENLVRLRKARGFTVRGLGEALTKTGRSVPDASAISSIENGKRRVDVDDLVALAAALGVSPLALLLPSALSPDDMVEVTGVGAVRAADVWAWAAGRAPLDQGQTGRAAYEAAMTFKLYGQPHWLNGGDF
ncbi:helix-turn-helix domain-containing protein [Streptomyces sp. NPDC050145]|uniref:helix-turn-helix domain-containing protein n=1 Tax=Streptomyces sp. NPDC050145 TaxID=3365602 RepID=UPI0037AB56BF